MRKILLPIILVLSMMVLVSCNVDDVIKENSGSPNDTILSLDDLQQTEHFRNGALAHILEGELNRNGLAVGFHYDGLPSKKGTIISGTETAPDENGIFEAKVEINGTKKTSNSGMSSFFPSDWNAQDVIDAINAAYDARQFITGNTYEGLDTNGIIIRMYLDDQKKIISAFPIY